ncbi:MAG: hypothetical protein AAF982_04985 [Pseudomonadota bacterium]
MSRLLLCFLCFANAALADVDQGGGMTECYCTDGQGARVELGQTICLHVDGRAFSARCEMALNNPFWRETGESCVSS